MNPIVFLFVFVVTAISLAFIIALVARFWILRSEPLTLRGIDIPQATNLVGAYVQGTHDHRFAFPTGVFLVDVDQTSPGRVVAREANFKGSMGMRLVRFGIVLPAIGAAMGAAAMEDEGAGAMIMGVAAGFMAGCFLAVILIGPILCMVVIEVVLRYLLRSQVTALIEKDAEHDDAVKVRFELQGLSSFGILPALRRGLAAPVLPAKYRAIAGLPEPTHVPIAKRTDRLQAIYAIGGTLAIVVALVVALTAPGLHLGGGTGPAYAGPPSGGSSPPSPLPPAHSTSYPLMNSGSQVVRSAPSATAPIVGEVDSSVVIVCTTQGDSISGSTLWDRIEQPSGFVSNTVVDTGSSSAVAAQCTGANQPTPPTNVAQPSNPQAAAMIQTVQLHWKDRLDGSTSAVGQAYDAYGTPLQNKAGSRDPWIQGIQADGLTNINIQHLNARQTGPTSGVAHLIITTQSNQAGCKYWDFNYTMRLGGGRWLMWDQSISDNHGC